MNVPPAPIWVCGDFARLELRSSATCLHNAAKYTPDNGKLDVHVVVEQGQAVVSVRDNGIGIDAQFLPHVFELFTQGYRRLDRSQGGLGVGLAVVGASSSCIKGSVNVASDGTGKGSEFSVALPCISEVGISTRRAPRRIA